MIAAAKAKGVRVIPTVEWGDGTQEQAILSDPTKRVELEEDIAALVQQNNFDGIDIDFEAKQARPSTTSQPSSRASTRAWAASGSTAPSRQEKPLDDRYSPGATIPADATDYANDYSAMNSYCDRVEIMAYDQGTIDLRLDNARVAPYAPVADPGLGRGGG